MRVLSYSDLRAKGIIFSKTWINKLVKESKFPKPLHLGENRVAFVEAEVDAWLRDRAAERDTDTPATKSA
jgi:prophage regulatory protein